MPSWPEILSKYNIILSQTHSFSMNLMSHPPSSTAASTASSSRSAGGSVNQLERIALHPSMGMTDAQLDGEVIPLLRNQQTLDVLRVENESVRRLAEHMATRGSLGVLGGAPPAPANTFGFGMGTKKPVEYEDVLKECDEIRSAHDRRVDRAVRAVMMLREKFDWKQRVEVEVEEPEELEWDPRMRQIQEQLGGDEVEMGGVDDEILGNADQGGNGIDADGDAGMESPDRESSDEGEEVQALMDSALDAQTPAAMPMSTDDPPPDSSTTGVPDAPAL
jgi:hypothetical protein